MPRYIDAEKIKYTEYINGDVTVSKDLVEKIPTADVQEVGHGKMNMYKPRSMNRNATYKCSVCGKLCSSYYNDVGEWKFCPHCGAKMDGEHEQTT